MTHITSKTFKTREDFITYKRSNFMVSGSNIGTILGHNPYCSTYQLCFDLQNPQENTENESINRGIFMEEAIVNWFEHETGFKAIKKSAGYVVYFNSKLPSCVECTPDRELFKQGEEKRPLLEVKDTTLIINSIDDIPQMWFDQVQHQMGVMERDICYLVINDGRKRLQYFKFEYNNNYFIDNISAASEWYHRFYKNGEEPPIETEEDLKLKWPQSVAISKAVDYNFMSHIEAIKNAKELLIACEKAKKEQEVEIKKMFGEYDTLTFEGLPVATYKSDKNGNRRLKIL